MRAWGWPGMCAAPMGMMAAGDQRAGGDVLAAWAESLSGRARAHRDPVFVSGGQAKRAGDGLPGYYAGQPLLSCSFRNGSKGSRPPNDASSCSKPSRPKCGAVRRSPAQSLGRRGRPWNCLTGILGLLPWLTQRGQRVGEGEQDESDQRRGKDCPRSDSGRGPKMRRSASAMGTSLILASSGGCSDTTSAQPDDLIEPSMFCSLPTASIRRTCPGRRRSGNRVDEAVAHRHHTLDLTEPRCRCQPD